MMAGAWAVHREPVVVLLLCVIVCASGVAGRIFSSSPPRLPPSGLPHDTVQIGVLIPLTGSYAGFGACTAKAACLTVVDDWAKCNFTDDMRGVRWPNIAQSTLTGDKIDLVFHDTGNQGQAFFSTLDTLCFQSKQPDCPRSSILYGPLFSQNAIPSQQVASEFNVAQLSPGAISTLLSLTTQYRTFSRTIGTPAWEAVLWAVLCNSYGWTNVAVLSESDTMSTLTADIFGQELRHRSNNRATYSLDSFEGADNFEALLQDVAEGPTRIVILVLTSLDLEVVANTLSGLGMTGNSPPAPDGHNWGVIIASSYSATVKAAPASLLKQLDGALLFDDYIATGSSKYNYVQQQWEKITQMYPEAGCKDMNPAVPFMVDGISFLVDGMFNALDVARNQEGITLSASDIIGQGNATQQVLRNLTGTGVTGFIILDEKGDRHSPCTVLNIVGGALNNVGSVQPVNSTSKLVVDAVTVDVQTDQIVWPRGRKKPPVGGNSDVYTWIPTQALLTGVLVYSVINNIIAVTFGVLIIVHRKRKVINWSSPGFCLFLLVGPMLNAAIDATGAMHDYFTTNLVLSCDVVSWAKMLAFTITFASVFSRTYRINKIFMRRNALRRIVVSDREVTFVIVVVVVGFSILHLLWWLLAPYQHVTMSYTGTPEASFATLAPEVTYHFMVCAGSSGTFQAFKYTALVMNTGLLAWGALLAYQTRKVPAGFNESRYLGYAIYNGLIVVVMLTPLIDITIRSNPGAYIALNVFAGSWPLLVTMLVLFVPKFVAVYSHKRLTLSATPSKPHQHYHRSDSLDVALMQSPKHSESSVRSIQSVRE